MGKCCCPDVDTGGDGGGCFAIIIVVLGYAIFEMITKYWIPITIGLLVIFAIYMFIKYIK
jgi:hypothetical protein